MYLRRVRHAFIIGILLRYNFACLFFLPCGFQLYALGEPSWDKGGPPLQDLPLAAQSL